MSVPPDSALANLEQLVADLQRQLVECKAERDEALEQQTAMAKVVQVINSSPGNLAPVFDAILEKALALCGADRGIIRTFDGEAFHMGAMRGIPTEIAELMRAPRRPPFTGMALERLVAGELVVEIEDIANQAGYRAGAPTLRAMADTAGARTGLWVALRKDDVLLGLIWVYRLEVKPFTSIQVALLQNFAAQTVIAMENARLLGELRGRTRDLQESLDYQTATSDVLKVISQSTFDLRPVLETVAETAARLCTSEIVTILRRHADGYRVAAAQGWSPEYRAFLENHTFGAADQGTLTGRVVLERRAVQVTDITADPTYTLTEAATLGKARTQLGVPLLREGEPIGVIIVSRQRVEPFTQKQIELVIAFADQAVIAMENARLLGELRQRTLDLQQSLEYQTATSDVLKVISRTDARLESALETLVATAARICAADQGAIHQLRGGLHFVSASVGTNPEYRDYVARNPIAPGRGTAIGRMALERRPIHIEDVLADPEYTGSELQRLGGFRSVLAVPLLREDVVIGSILLTRSRVEPFIDKQIELLRTFADQAVIAIENARLLGELRERTDQIAELNRGLEARVAEQVEELGRVGRLKRFLAPQLAELIVSQGDEKILESHRREIVVVFCDLRGYTAFAETAEPEEVFDFLRQYHGALGPLVSQFEGTLDQFSGDGIMVFFNDPVPIPDPAERAVKMSVAMREAASTLIAAWRERGRELGFGVGLAQGYATLGQIGFSERSGYTAIGTVCNVAARLCGEAKDGQILLSQRVNVALKGSVATEQVGALALKGLTQPVVAYNVPLTASQPALRVIDGGNH